MSQPEDRIVYVCGCVDYMLCGHNAANIEPVDWSAGDVGKECRYCRQPITAINIDRLLRIEEASTWAKDAHDKKDKVEFAAALAAIYYSLDANPGGSDE